jgi:deoxyribonuclease-4
MAIRVRQILSTLNTVERQELKKLLPPKLKVPEEPDGVRYPAALLSQLAVASPGEQYGLLGFITEDLVALPVADITQERLCQVVQERCPSLTPALLAKITKSKTTEPFLEHIRETQKKLRAAAGAAELRHEETVGNAILEGHPDYRTDTQVFEVKMTGQLKKNWVDFLFQVFAYAALAPEVTDIYLVLPLQEILWHYDVRSWKTSGAYRAFLEAAITKKSSSKGEAHALVQAFNIGNHMHKLKSLALTVFALPPDRPSQIFLAGPQSSKLEIADAELAAAGAVASNYFIHSAYIINLCTKASADNEAYHTRLLIKNLQYGAAAGAKGVVVHVGKSTTQPLPEALATMRANLLEAMEHATSTCPILLETPAGQGSEVLCAPADFIGFVAAFADPRIQICVDTCHVFASGHDPLDYIKKVPDGLLKLIHFNDSAAVCGSCVDRHAFVGEGHVGLAKMTEIAHYARSKSIPMLVE